MTKTFKKSVTISTCIVSFILIATAIHQIYIKFIASPDIDIFHNKIYLTQSNYKTGLIKFLERNIEKVIFIDNYIDTSLSVTENWIVEEKCNVDIDAVMEFKINGKPIALPLYEDINDFANCGNIYLVLDIGNLTTYEYSSGGTGIVQIRFKGFFEVSKSYHSGSKVYYHLNEVSIPSKTEQ